jgi:hypothetical protein
MAQQNNKESIVINKRGFYAGSVYLDSVKVNIEKIFPDPDNILEVKSYSGSQSDIYSHAPNAMFITRKEQKDLTLLYDFYRKGANPIKFVIDSKYIQNPFNTYIETLCITAITILDTFGGAMHDPPSTQLIITTKRNYQDNK